MEENERKEVNENKLQISSLCYSLNIYNENVRNLSRLVAEFLEVAAKEKEQLYQQKYDIEQHRQALWAVLKEQIALREAFAFKIPAKLEESLVKRAEELSLDDHYQMVKKIRAGEVINILPTPKKKKGKK